MCRKCLPYIGEIQVADVPGRQEPGIGEINYPKIAEALYQMGYRGTIGFEAYASGKPEQAIEAFRRALTVANPN